MGLLLPEDVLSQILASLPVISLLRFKSVCKSWRSLIQSSFFIDLHVATSSSSKFGSFIFHAAVAGSHSYLGRSRESAVLMLSSGSEAEFESKSKSKSRSESGRWCWSTGTDFICTLFNGDFTCPPLWNNSFDDKPVFKVVDNSYEDQTHQLVFKLDNLGIPSRYQFYTKKNSKQFYPQYIVGSCNGLICLYDVEHNDISLWNPATRQFRILPKSINIEEDASDYSFIHKFGPDYWISRERFSVAFGFDVENKDYKVVLLTCYDDDDIEWHCQVQVYNLSSDSWRLLEGINTLPGYPGSREHESHGLSEGLYLNGSCYFIAMDRNCSWMIISFNFTKEIFTAMQLPDNDIRHDFFLSSLGEKLVLFRKRDVDVDVDDDDDDDYDYYDYYDIFSDNKDEDDDIFSDNKADHPYDEDKRYIFKVDFDIWVLNEHGGNVNKESWRKLHSFQIEIDIGCEWIPRGISNNGEFVLFEFREEFLTEPSKKMKLYNLVTKEANLVTRETKRNFLSCNQVMSRAVLHQPSLVSIIGDVKSHYPHANPSFDYCKEAQKSSCSKAKEAQKPSSR